MAELQKVNLEKKEVSKTDSFNLSEEMNKEVERRVQERTVELASAYAELEVKLPERKRLQTERDQFFDLSLDLLTIINFDTYIKYVNPRMVQ